jgi:hypothetical protein
MGLIEAEEGQITLRRRCAVMMKSLKSSERDGGRGKSDFEVLKLCRAVA